LYEIVQNGKPFRMQIMFINQYKCRIGTIKLKFTTFEANNGKKSMLVLRSQKNYISKEEILQIYEAQTQTSDTILTNKKLNVFTCFGNMCRPSNKSSIQEACNIVEKSILQKEIYTTNIIKFEYQFV
jgi:hypothetical protein